MEPAPLRVAILNDYEIVVAGVAALLAPFSDRVIVVELDAGVPVRAEVDVVLYDTFGQPQADRLVLADHVSPDSRAKVVVYSWNVEEPLLSSAAHHGVAGYIGKGITAEDFVTALEQVHAGSWVGPLGDPSTRDVAGRWPGQDEGLTARESEVLALICQGLSNDELGRHAFIGANTVKTHIRHLYRKVGVASRSQAVVWGLQRGFAPDHSRRSPS